MKIRENEQGQARDLRASLSYKYLQKKTPSEKLKLKQNKE